MAFPVVAANITSSWNGQTASITMTPPTGTVAGDLLLMVFSKRGSVAPTFSGTGWVTLGTMLSSGLIWTRAYYKVADGNDGGTFTYGETVNGSYVVYRITGADTATAPEVAVGSLSSSASPNPPALTLSGWGAEDTLWVTALSFGEGPALSAYPTIAPDNRRLAGQAAAWGSRTAMATWNSTATSQDPGNWTLEYGFANVPWTFAVRPAAAAIVPDPPVIGTATAGDQTVNIAFTPPASNGGPAVTGYTATLSPGSISKSGASSPIVFGAGDGIVNGTAYTGTVLATNSIGNSSPSAASNSVTPAPALSPPGAPTGVTALAGDASASVSFSAPGSSGGSAIIDYRVTASPGGITGTGASSPITVSGLTNGTEYTFTVTATNTEGTGPASAVSNAVTPGIVTYTITSPSTFALNTGSNARPAGTIFYWWGFPGISIGDDPGSVTAQYGTGSLDINGLAVLSGLPVSGQWEIQVRFDDGGTARWTGIAI